MTTNRFKLNPVLVAILGGVSLLSACGGGGSNDDSGPPPAVVPASVDVATAVIDGAILNATVCMDKNDNGICDEGEYAAKTAADGSVTLKVAPADKGKYTLLAVVPADAVDAGTGQAVGTAYSMRTPADQPALITPLTTLVKAQMDLAGQASADAAKALQDAAGLALPMFADFSKGSDELARASAAIARLVVLAKQGASTALKDAIGKEDSNKVPVTALDVDRVVNSRLLDLLPSIVAAGTADAVANATGSARDDALKAAAQGLVANELGLSAATLPLIVGNAKKPDAAPAVAGAGANMAWFTYTSPTSWYFRYYASTAAQNVPDSKGLTRFTDNRKRAVAAGVQVWGDTPAYTRTDLYFDGSTWFACPTSFENTATVRDAQGRAESLYCGAYQGKSVRAVRDVAGLSIASVVKEIRAYPLTSTQGAYPEWGPNPALLNAGATFPANSKLFYQTSTQLANPDGYGTLDSNLARVFVADVAAGGTPAFDANGVASLACGKVTSANFADYQIVPATLEALVAANPGKPCVFGPNANAGARNDWWSASTLNIGTVAGPVPANSYYQSNRVIRAGFGSGNAVAFYNCALRASDGSSRNCEPAGAGTWRIDTVGDARVMRFTGVPAAATSLTYNRQFVERGGKVFYGFRDKLRVDNAVRLNAEAMDALLGQLNLSR